MFTNKQTICGCRAGPTAQQGLVASVREWQRAQALQSLVQNPAQVARVPQAAHGQAVQVHRLHKVAEQRPLQAQDVPPGEGRRRDGGEGRGRGGQRSDG